MERSRVVEQALQVLEVIGERGPMSPSEISRVTGQNRTVVHRMLATLHARGFLRQAGGTYHLGALFLKFAETIEPALRAAVREVIEGLARDTEETVVLSVPDDTDSVAIEQVIGRAHPIRVEYELGSRRPLASGASGRAILAFAPDDVLARVLDAADHPGPLRRQLDEVRQLGYAISHDELKQGVHGIAAPVLGDDGHAGAAVSVLTPSVRAANIAGHTEALLKAVEEISQHWPPHRRP
ncbi:IclR family transcriptional regulator [Actinomadura macra]|uniref:IclR family transcriptional regulator n=1 Tax=Actinomadura macra TaxID=46164 RepID=UPI00082DD431|nr:IclR family transcriptional regulator [Actinomadura macra]